MREAGGENGASVGVKRHQRFKKLDGICIFERVMLLVVFFK
jgi:hypothetical protein